MIGTYASVALICAASLLVGRAILALCGRRDWSWLEPAVGFAALVAVAGLLARAPGHGTTASLGIVLLLVASLATLRLPYSARGALAHGLPVAITIVAVLSIPFLINDRWGLLGVGVNNDLGLHLAWSEWLRSGLGPVPEVGYPLGPHAVAVTAAAFPGIGLGQAFVGEIVAIPALIGLTALAALRDLGPVRRTFAATLVAVPYLAAAYFAQGIFKETAEALFALAFAVGLMRLGPVPTGTRDRLLLALPFAVIAAGAFFAYSFAGFAWPVAIVALWALATQPAVRAAVSPRRLLGFLLRPVTLAVVVVLAVLAIAVTAVGPFGFADEFSRVAGTNTYGPVSPVEALGVWPSSNYRLDAAGGARLPALAAAIAVLALIAGLAWWIRRRELAVPAALGACAALYLASLPVSGDYSRAKALMIAAPLAMLIAARPLLVNLLPPRRGESVPDEDGIVPSATSGTAARAAWAALAVAFLGGAVYSSLLVLREAPVGPPGHGAELRAFWPTLHGERVLYAGQDRFAAYQLLGADTVVPIIEFPDEDVDENPEKPFDTGEAYSPIDFDSFTYKTLNRFPYVVAGRAAWTSQAPAGFRRIDATPSYLLWERHGEARENRHTVLEGTEAAAPVDCASPEMRILVSNPGRASLVGTPAIGPKDAWSPGNLLRAGEQASQVLKLPAGRWQLSLQYFSPFGLTLSAPGFEQPLKAALDGQRPNTISLINNGQFWPAGEVVSDGGPVRFTVSADEPSAIQRLTGYNGKADLGELVAIPADSRRSAPLREACGNWVDWYRADAAP